MMFTKNKTIFGVLLIAALSIMVTSVTYAYVLKGWKITSALTYRPYNGFASTSISHMQQSVGKWNAQAGKTLMTVSSTTHTATNYPSSDGNNYIYRKDVGAGYLAQNTNWYNTSTWSVVESDINVNVYYPWANSAQSGCYDVYTVMLHEFGHSVGLGDISSVLSYDTCVMWYQGQTNKEKRDLKTDDKNGVNAIY